VCIQCPGGRYRESVGANGINKCLLCPILPDGIGSNCGTVETSFNRTGSVHLTACSPGTHQSTAGACIACPAGTFSDVLNAASCTVKKITLQCILPLTSHTVSGLRGRQISRPGGQDLLRGPYCVCCRDEHRHQRVEDVRSHVHSVRRREIFCCAQFTHLPSVSREQVPAQSSAVVLQYKAAVQPRQLRSR
jgi:hypothetical protein